MTIRKKEYLVTCIIYTITGLAMMVLIVAVLIVFKGDGEIKDLEASLGVSSSYEEYFIQTEYISIEEKMSQYINSLQMPKTEVNALDENAVEEIQEIQAIETTANQKNELSEMVEGITPTVQTFNTSAYCPCKKCCVKDDGITASLEPAVEWYTVAAGSCYEFGTIIYIPELSDKPNGGWFIVQDRGGAILEDKLDVFFYEHTTAKNFGRQYLEAYVYQF